MSDPGAFYVGANHYDDLPARTPEQVDAAYYEIFTSPAGQAVQDDLYAYVCITLRPSEEQFLEPGMKALWVHIQRRIHTHRMRGRAFERGNDGR